MSVRFTSGGVGRFGFDEANATLDAADAMVGRFGDAGRPIDPTQPRPIVARLTHDRGTEFFAPTPEGATFRVWDWEQVHAKSGPPQRQIVAAPNGKDSLSYGELPNGRAIQLSGSAQVGDIVVLFKLMNDESKRSWFVFAGVVGSGIASLLEITASEPISENEQSPSWLYTVKPVKLTPSFELVDNLTLPQGQAINLYEYGVSWGHGQRLQWPENQTSRMIAFRVQGIVHGVLSNTIGSTGIWAFEATCPMRPVCITNPFGLQGSRDAELLEGGKI